MLDSLRADHLKCYSKYISCNSQGLGPKLPIKTPFINKLAQECTLFYQAYPEGVVTLPVRITCFTGRIHHPFRGWQPPEKNDLLLSEVLGEHGYETCLVTDTYHMRANGYGRGFKTAKFIRGQEYDWEYLLKLPFFRTPPKYFKYKKTISLHTILHRIVDKQTLNNLNRLGANPIFRRKQDTFVARTFNAAKQYLDQHKGDDKMFLWIDSFDPHEPWNPPPPYTHMYNRGYKGRDLINPQPGTIEGYLTKEELYNIRSLYAGEVTLVDEYVGRFIHYLKEEGFLENSLLIFLSDHGECLGESHGNVNPPIIRKDKPFLYEELIRIPLMIRHPDGYSAGQANGDYVLTCDIMPTILDYLGIKLPKVMDGTSLLPLLHEDQAKIRDTAHVGWFPFSYSIRTEEFSYHRFGKHHAELYNLQKDPLESEDLLKIEDKGLIRALDRKILNFSKQIRQKHPSEKPRPPFKSFWIFSE